jgi:probable O-glycosylation ligase (exosortase A-associated)
VRDLLVTLIVAGSLPVILARPWIGIIMWAWLSYMNPHRLTWGFAYDFPFAQVVAIATLVGFLFTKERSGIPINRITITWLALIAWMCVTTVFALDRGVSVVEWDRTMKIQLMAIVTLLLIRTPLQVNALVWTIALSIGFFGFKGGVFAFRTGAEAGISGPMESFIEDNNALGLALVMIVPLLWYLQMRETRRWLKWGLLGGILLCGLAIFGTHSRGALLAAIAMALFLVLNTRGRVWAIVLLAIAVPLLWAFMPESWHERMFSIKDYQQDTSAMGRINAWWFAWNLALDRPLLGGGFDTFTRPLFEKYAPNPLDFHDSHSIYFEMLAEHGFVGLGLFLFLGAFAFIECGRIARRIRRYGEDTGQNDLSWGADLLPMVRVSIVGYFVGGAFLGLAYYDLYYHLVGLVVLVQRLIDERLAQTPASARAPPKPQPQPGTQRRFRRTGAVRPAGRRSTARMRG